jgi:hypothetical protein
MHIMAVHPGKDLALPHRVAEIEVDLLDSPFSENANAPSCIVRQSDVAFSTLAHDGSAKFDRRDFDLLFSLRLRR